MTVTDPIKIVALIPLRAGSKSIPGKNIKIIAGKPLCAWVIDAAYNSSLFDEIVVSTDSKKIAEVVNKINKHVKIIMRPKNLATDRSTTESVMLHLLKKVDFDILFTIQATSPLTTAQDFKEVYKKFQSEKLDSLLTAVKLKRFVWSKDAIPCNYNPLSRPMRQNIQGVYIENGAFYITKRSILAKYKCRLGGKIGIYPMDVDDMIELDEVKDWETIESIIIKKILCSDMN